jgi:mono/diheme cytochrome c family protein
MQMFAFRYLAVALGLSALVAFSGQAGAEPVSSDRIGDVAAGRRLAEAWCAECHATGRKIVDAGRRGPDFQEIADRASTTARALHVFLRSNHEEMPNFIVAGADADNIVAYILSLKQR